ncbi:MAG: hypothetical protein ACK415_08325 [Thermodesulfovibrionales bacterium]
MEKIEFLTRVSEVMKSMVSYEAMMESLRRSCLRSEAENIDLLTREETKVDRLIEESDGVNEIKASEDTFDALILRYLKNTQFLSSIEEEYIDISGLDNDIAFWKKTMLFRAP